MTPVAFDGFDGVDMAQLGGVLPQHIIGWISQAEAALTEMAEMGHSQDLIHKAEWPFNKDPVQSL